MSDIRVQQARSALQADPTQAQLWVGYVQALIDAGQLAEADKTIVVAARKGLAEPVLHDLAHRRAQAQQQPVPSVGTAPSAAPHAAVPSQQEINQLAALFQAQRLAELVPLAQRMTTDYPGFAFGWSVLGAALATLNRHGEALGPSERAVRLAPLDASAHSNLGQVHLILGHLEQAETCLLRVRELDPDHTAALAALGRLMHARGELAGAQSCFTRLVQLQPQRADASYNLGTVFQALGHLEDARLCFDAAIRLNADFVDAHYNRGLVLHALQLREQSVASIERAIALNPAFADAHFNLGIVLHELGALGDAADHGRQAIAANPDYAKAYNNLGNVLKDQGQVEEALEAYQRALDRQSDYLSAYSNLLFVLNYHPDKAAEEIYAAYQTYEQQFGGPLRAQWPVHAKSALTLAASSSALSVPPRRLRIGYVSPDLRQHSVRHFLEPLLACHDRLRFEVFAYAELAREDAVTERYRSCCDHFILTRGMSDEELASRIRADAIDVLVDVAGHTAGNRLLVFARKPAPVSLSWLGYGYTTGLKAIDYLLTDEASAPAGSEHLFSEAPWRLPGAAYVYRPDPAMGQLSALPALANGFLTFGTLTRAIRINHRTVRVWAEILQRVPGSRLVIDSKNFQHASMQEAMAERFAQHGIARERLLIGCHSPPWDTLRSIDIGLDCFPHNSGTTLFETLFMGVPYVTLAGRPSVGRLGKSILSGLGKPEWLNAWCATSEQEYIDKAIALASDLTALARIRTELRPQMQRSALMDEAGFVRNVEEAYLGMFSAKQLANSEQQNLTEIDFGPSRTTREHS